MKKLLFAMGAATLAAAPAAAQDQVTIIAEEGLPTAEVFHADLNLGEAADLTVLKSRIKTAARNLCISGNVEPIGMKAAQRGCYNFAKADGFAQVERIEQARLAGNVAAAKAVIVLRTR